MARETRRSGSERFKYGICLNDECSKCKEKEIQKIPMRKEFVCEECGKELRECPPPKKKNNLPIIIGVAIIVIAAIIGCIFAFSGGESEMPEEVSTVDSVSAAPTTDTVTVTETRVDTVKIEKVVEKETTPTAQKTTTTTTTTSKSTGSVSGSLRLSYGKYTGATKNGYPHGQGKLTYSTSRVINRNDAKGRTANAGDYVIGEFFNGFVVYGKHYDASGNLIGSLNFGVGSEDSYESK